MTAASARTDGAPSGARADQAKRWLHELGEVLIYEQIKNFLTALFTKWREKTVEPAAEHLKEWSMAKLFGLKTEDERRYNAALALLDPNEADVLTLRLGNLTQQQSDYYRITVMQDNPTDMARIMAQHAQMPDDVWAAHCKTMNLNLDNANKQFYSYMEWVWDYVKQLHEQLATYLDQCAKQWREDANEMRAARQRRNSNMFKIVFFGFTRALAIPGPPRRRAAMNNENNDTTRRDDQDQDNNSRRNDCGDSNPRRGKLGFAFCFRGIEFAFTGINLDAGLYWQGRKKAETAETITNPPATAGLNR